MGLDPHLFGTHSLRRTKATLIYRRTGNLRAVQLLLGHTKIEAPSDISALRSMIRWIEPIPPSLFPVSIPCIHSLYPFLQYDFRCNTRISANRSRRLTAPSASAIAHSNRYPFP
jgi:hypothetical protein